MDDSATPELVNTSLYLAQLYSYDNIVLSKSSAFSSKLVGKLATCKEGYSPICKRLTVVSPLLFRDAQGSSLHPILVRPTKIKRPETWG